MVDFGCDRHAEVIESIDDLEDRVKYLELSDSEVKNELKKLLLRLDKLCQTMEKVMAGAWKIIVAVAASGIVFLVWYIQSV